MLSSWSSTIITVFGISHLLESSVGEPRRGGLRARLRTARSESLVPIRYRNANNDLRPRAPQGELPLPSSAIGIYIASAATGTPHKPHESCELGPEGAIGIKARATCITSLSGSFCL